MVFVLNSIGGLFEMHRRPTSSAPKADVNGPNDTASTFSIEGYVYGRFALASTLILYAVVAGSTTGTQTSCFVRIYTPPTPSGNITNIAPATILADPLFSLRLGLPVPSKDAKWDLPDTIPSDAGSGPDTALQSLAADLVLNMSNSAGSKSYMILQYAQTNVSITGNWTILTGFVLENLNFAVLVYNPAITDSSGTSVEIHLGGLFTFTPPSAATSSTLFMEASFEKEGSGSSFYSSISAVSSAPALKRISHGKNLGMTPDSLRSLPIFGGEPVS